MRQTKANKVDDTKWADHKKWLEDLLTENNIEVGTDEEFDDGLDRYELDADMFDEDDFTAWDDEL